MGDLSNPSLARRYCWQCGLPCESRKPGEAPEPTRCTPSCTASPDTAWYLDRILECVGDGACVSITRHQGAQVQAVIVARSICGRVEEGTHAAIRSLYEEIRSRVFKQHEEAEAMLAALGDR